jgi:ADP-ribose pyrophosphatase YjhB (NUDIX family)
MEENIVQVRKGAAVVAFDENKVLLVRNGEKSGHTTGVYGLPAGSLKEGEEYVDAAAREFNEESGLNTEKRYLVKLPTFYEAELKRKDGQKKF